MDKNKDKEQWLKVWAKETEAIEESRNPELIEKRVRKETAEQIFADLRKIITLFPNDIDEPDIKVIFPESDKYKVVEKKYGVD